jgi:hypothetical protein
MGVDRIGKGGPPAPTQSKETTPAKEAGRPFEVKKPDQSASVERTAPTTPLERLRAGAIDVNGYVDAKVDEATAHLHGLPRVELDAIKKALRDQMTSDPMLVDLVRRATGVEPPKDPDE